MTLAAALPLATFLALSSLHGCTRGAALTERNESSTGQQTTLQVGEQLRINLPENATTGYHWQLGSECTALLKLEHDETAPPSSSALGAPHVHYWLFTAASPGECHLRFESVRSWEKNAAGKTLIFPVSIH